MHSVCPLVSLLASCCWHAIIFLAYLVSYSYVFVDLLDPLLSVFDQVLGKLSSPSYK